MKRESNPKFEYLSTTQTPLGKRLELASNALIKSNHVKSIATATTTTLTTTTALLASSAPKKENKSVTASNLTGTKTPGTTTTSYNSLPKPAIKQNTVRSISNNVLNLKLMLMKNQQNVIKSSSYLTNLGGKQQEEAQTQLAQIKDSLLKIKPAQPNSLLSLNETNSSLCGKLNYSTTSNSRLYESKSSNTLERDKQKFIIYENKSKPLNMIQAGKQELKTMTTTMTTIDTIIKSKQQQPNADDGKCVPNVEQQHQQQAKKKSIDEIHTKNCNPRITIESVTSNRITDEESEAKPNEV